MIAYWIRGLFVLLLVYCLVMGIWGTFVANFVVFLVTLPLLYLGREEKRYLLADSLISGLFSVSILVGLLGVGQTYGLYAILHLVGGFVLGWLGMIFYEKKISDKRVLYVTVVLVALAIGAGWEVFEYIISVIPPHNLHEGLADTILDLAVDTIGAAIAVSVSRL